MQIYILPVNIHEWMQKVSDDDAYDRFQFNRMLRFTDKE